MKVIHIMRRRHMITFLRKVLFLVFSLLLRWPIWIILVILRPLRLFHFLFLVYPGTERDLDGYCPRSIARSWFFKSKPAIGGIIAKGKHGKRGLLLVVPDTVRELRTNKKQCSAIMRRLQIIQKMIGAKSIAISGQGASIFHRHGLSIEEPFVKGAAGTIFCTTATIDAVIAHKDLKDPKICVFGVGYVGGVLMDALLQKGFSVKGIDMHSQKRNDVYSVKEACRILPEIDIVIVLTPKGSHFYPYVEHLKSQTIVVDDTHPKMLRFPRDDTPLYKVAVGLSETHFIPHLPGYRSEWIPGCAVEALVAATTGDYTNCDQEAFAENAYKLGFHALLVR